MIKKAGTGTSKVLKKYITSVENLVCREFGTSPEMFYGKDRLPEYTRARWIIFYILNRKAGLSYSSISRNYGIDHTTVSHGIKRFMALNMDCSDFFQKVDKLLITMPFFGDNRLITYAEKPEIPNTCGNSGKDVDNNVDNFSSKSP